MTLQPDSIAVDLLAWQDAVFAPIRGMAADESSFAATVTGIRLRVAEAGVPFRPRHRDASAQKADQRELDQLAEAGAIIQYRGRAGRATGCRLLNAGESAARSLCGLPGIDDSLLALREIAECEAEGLAVECRGMRLVSESTIEQVPYGAPEARERFAVLRDFLFPALARDWVRGHSTVAGHVFYELTPAVRAILARSKPAARPKPAIATALALRGYDLAFGRALNALRSMPPADANEIGPLPIQSLPIPTRKGVRASA